MARRALPKASRKPNKSKPRSRFAPFSTLSEGTLHSPSLTLCLGWVATIYHRHITSRDGCHASLRDIDWEHRFDVDHFIASRYDPVMLPSFIYTGGGSVLEQRRQSPTITVPTLAGIKTFLIGIFKRLHLNVESSIVCLIYTERLMEKRHICLTARNWRSILITSILTASKVWDDLSSWNVEFSHLLPVLSLGSVNKLEALYLQALSYDLYISSSEYATYYFALRGLKNTKTHSIPRYYTQTKIVNSSSKQACHDPNSPSISRSVRDDDERKCSACDDDTCNMCTVERDRDHSLLSTKSGTGTCGTGTTINGIVSNIDSSRRSSDHDRHAYDHTMNAHTLAFSSDSDETHESRRSRSQHSNQSSTVMVTEQPQRKRSQAMLLKPKQLPTSLAAQIPSYSMPSNVRTLHPFKGLHTS